jgi:hypothetical protein
VVSAAQLAEVVGFSAEMTDAGTSAERPLSVYQDVSPVDSFFTGSQIDLNGSPTGWENGISQEVLP